ncbi:GPI ethanolamine phosphate transferase 2 [Escovopsis weberi]|uniref:GPI ethanolamine phosphate transferase 2 n=1 Tax=Escovopsis weberi TaxID=150374 RepID=A0A0M8MYE8_ESCWE|nr:GPI ethanolamine phosphate transferase 2 [Escovopsis weberi]
MPRIKAITTGSIPSFVDLILNFDEADTSSTLAAQDTWLAQIKAKTSGKLLMYGDDTWLKLFPGTFDRHDGTTSFFVSDFTEVDHNVTRHVAGELANDDWSLMVLHYLGLDHIGHKSGPHSAHMPAKQREMDGIVEDIFEALESQSHLGSTLLVLCGDHGMNDAGNHGASSPGETSPALVFMSPKLKEISTGYAAPARPENEFDYYSTVEQSDITPTLAALLGFPISKNNLGAFIFEFLPFWPDPRDQVQLLVRNAQQILGIVTAAFGSELFDAQSDIDPCGLEPSQMNQLACDWRSISRRAAPQASLAKVDEAWLQAMSSWIRQAQELMSGMASNYDMPKLFLGQGLSILSVVLAVICLCMRSLRSTGTAFSVALVALSYGPMMFASSYVEEEHHFWYWSTTLWLSYLASSASRRNPGFATVTKYVMAFAALRLIRGWNQTGQKFAGNPDIVKSFLVPNPQLLWVLISLTYLLVCSQMLVPLSALPLYVAAPSAVALLLASLGFKLAFTAEDAPEVVVGFARSLHAALPNQSLVLRARIVFAILSTLAAYAIYRARSSPSRGVSSPALLLHHLYTLLAMTQSRAANIPIFLLFNVLHVVIKSADLSVAGITTTSILLQYTSFFAFGGSNAISSVDLSSAYNGISNFNVLSVGLLTLVSNWAGPIYWTFSTNLLLLQKHRQGNRDTLRQHLVLSTLFSATSAAFVMAACTALRTHLFIWTVFSPKYLYCMAWSLGQHLLINVGLGSLLFWIGP